MATTSQGLVKIDRYAPTSLRSAADPRARGTRTFALRWVGVLVSALVLLVGLPATAGHAATSPEQQFLQLVNATRGAHGVAPLQSSPVISDVASRPWSERMASTGTLAHTPQVFAAVSSRYPNTSIVGENVGYAGSVSALHDALMASPGHRANLLSSAYRYIGLGVAVSGSRTWVTQTFFDTTDAVAAPAVAPSADTVVATQRWVGSLYQDFLGRTAETSGRDFWAAQVLEGRMTQRQVAHAMATTPEWLNRFVDDLYVKTLGRHADADGLRFYASPEYYLRLGSRDDVWVNELYGALLGRTADADGIQFWLGRVQSQGRLQVAYQFFNGQENNMHRVGRLYDSLLGRSTDGAGLATWPAIIAVEGDLALASTLASSHEYWLRAQAR